MSMINADKLPVRRLVVARRKTGRKGKTYYVRERVDAVLEADLKAAAAERPRNRMERIQRMGAEELAQALLTLHDGEAGGYCRMKPECITALEDGTAGEITNENCLECMKAWLIGPCAADGPLR